MNNFVKKMIPELRFGEFSGDWEEKRLDKISKIERGRFSPRPRNNPIYYGGSIPFVQTGDVVHSNGRIEKYSQTLNVVGLKVSKLFPKGTILITIAANIGYAGILAEDMACPDSLIGITCKNNAINTFLNILFYIHQPKMDYLAVAAAQKNINIEFLKPYKLIIPELKEQQKIASFLTSVDQHISLLKQKKAALEQYKKGLMQKIFSQEIRFKDDEGKEFADWEEKRLGDVSNIQMGTSPKSSAYNNENYGLPLIQGNADIKDRQSTPRVFTSEITKECFPNDLLLSVRAPVGEVSKSNHHACIGRGMSAISSQSGTVIEFIFQYLLWFEPRWKRISQGSTFESVNTKDIAGLKLNLPSEDEQQKIADCLSSMDLSINKLKKQIEQTTQFKKGLLQRMFV